jgi:hypothetical protein
MQPRQVAACMPVGFACWRQPINSVSFESYRYTGQIVVSTTELLAMHQQQQQQRVGLLSIMIRQPTQSIVKNKAQLTPTVCAGVMQTERRDMSRQTAVSQSI